VSSAPGCGYARSPRREDQRKVGTSTRSAIGGQLLTTPAQLVASLTLLVAAIGLPTSAGAAWGSLAATHFPCLTSPCLCVSVVQSTPAPLAVRLEAVSRRHLGTRYRLDPLGEGPQGTVDQDPLWTWDAVDCVTYVEQCLAEALAPQAKAGQDLLRRIRYRDGVVSFETRNHYMLADWLPHNRALVEDVTGRVGGSACRQIEKSIDRAALLRARGGDPRAGGAPERLSVRYLPRAAVAAHLGRIPDGSLLILVSSRPGIDAAHVGFVFARGPDRIFRHASQRRGRVFEEPLTRFLAGAPQHMIGIKVCAIHPPR
jgi:N-acetylmuramoyl-L-alanine amidase-like